jgi:hypothetical protein
MHTLGRRYALVAVAAALAAAGAIVVVRAAGGGDGTTEASWAPSPRHTGGLTVLARAGNGRYALHTEHGDVTFLPGVNLGATTPGHQPGELPITAADYRRWFAEMGRLGIRAVRIYTIHPPLFYTELRAYNRAHPDAPLYSSRASTSPTSRTPRSLAACTTPPSRAPSARSSGTRSGRCAATSSARRRAVVPTGAGAPT